MLGVLRREFFTGDFQRVGAEGRQLFGQGPCGKVGHTAEAARVGVAQFPTVG